MRGVSRIVTAVSRFFGLVAAALLAVACLVICQSVFMRYVIEASTVWQTEFVKYAIVAATLVGAPYVLTIGGHVSVDLISAHLKPKMRYLQQLLAGLIALSFCAVLAWSGWQYFHEAWRNQWVTESVWAPPLWVVLLPLPLGVGLLCLQYLVELFGDANHAPVEIDSSHAEQE